MARVNDGNLLQHYVECELAVALAEEGALRLVATHAMAPFEPAENPDAHQHNQRARAMLQAHGGASALGRAYVASSASVERYPNTAELLASLLGRDALHGVLCEIDPEARLALEDAWRGSTLRIEGRSWREALEEGELLPPDPLEQPWLFSMDPYTWKLPGETKKEARGPDLVSEDLDVLRPTLTAHVKSGRVGAFCAFAYGLDPAHAKGFRTNALRLADRLGLERAVLGVDGRDGTRHLGVVLSSLEDLAAQTAASWHAFLADG